ncbi:MAG: glycosyltransferase [Candidatus Hodarchaeota archaeon]
MPHFLSKIFSIYSIKRVIKFATVGAIGTIINLSILYFFTEAYKVHYIISEMIAFFFSVINNYILNKLWTFKEKIQEKIVNKYLKYLIVSLMSLIANLIVLFILVEYFNIWYIFAEVIAIMFAFFINYSGNYLWTFGNPTFMDEKIAKFERRDLKQIKASIIIPTLNEHGNIERLIKKINDITRNYDINNEIIVVDDNSIDGTIEDVRRLQSSQNNLKLIIREKPEGIGTAHIVGYNEAQGDIILSMDADLSHPPEKIPEFVSKIKLGYDMVMSSRYIPGGATDKNLKYYLISKLGGYFLSVTLGIKIIDFSTGYRAIRKELWEAIKNYKYSNKNIFLIESIYHAYKNGARLYEIPIFFKEREIGESKTHLIKEALKALILPIKLRIHYLKKK